MRKNNLAYHLSEVKKFSEYIDHQKLIVGIQQSDEIYALANRSVSLKFLKKIGYRIQIVLNCPKSEQ